MKEQRATKGKKYRFLVKYANITGHMEWERVLSIKLEKHYFLHYPSLTDMARLYPTEHDLKLIKNGNHTHTLNGSRIYWSRIRNGNTEVTDNPCIRRVDKQNPGIKYIRTHSLWSLLGHPLASFSEVTKIIQQLKPSLSEKLFYIADNHLGFRYKRLYWSEENCELVNSIDTLAFQLALHRLNTMTPLENQWHLELKRITLLLLRTLTLINMSHISERILRLFLIFVKANDENISEDEIKNILTSKDIDFIFQQVFRLILPKPHKLPDEATTLDKYMMSNKQLAKNFWLDCHPNSQKRVPPKQFTMEILFWADNYSEYWIDGKTPKAKLLNPGTPLNKILRKQHSNGNRRQIW